MAKPIVNPNYGIHNNRASIALDQRMLADGNNFRIKDGKLNNLNLGWEALTDVQLNGAVLLVDNFTTGGNEFLILGTQYDLYKYNSDGTVDFLTPRYATGTAAANGTAVTGIGTTWSTNAEAGDEIHFGNNAQTDPEVTWYEIDSVGGNTSITLTASAGVIANGNYTIRKKFAGSAASPWVTDVFVEADPSGEDEWWATNGVDVPVRWNGTDTQVEVMSSLNLICKTLQVYANMMIYGNVTQTGTNKKTDIVNSDIGKPDDLSGGLSEQFRVHSSNDAIIRMEKIGDALAIYSEHPGPIVLAQFVGDELVFVFREVVSKHGLLAPKALANFGSYHEFLSADTQYRFDGVTLKEINKHFMRSILREQDPVRIAQSYTHFDIENGEVLWVVPSTTDPATGTVGQPPSRAVTEHYLELVPDSIPTPFSKRDFAFTATGFYSRQEGLTWDQLSEAWSEYNFRWNDQFFSVAFPLNIAGDANGNLWTFNTNQNADGDALESYVLFGRRAVLDGRMRGLVTRVYPFVTQFNNDLTVTTYMNDHAMGPATIAQVDAFDQNLVEGGHFVNPYRRGRFLQLKFGSAGPSEPWELAGYDIDLRPGGLR